MGNCFGQTNDSNNLSVEVSNVSLRNKVVTKGQHLKRDKLKWKSDIPLTAFHIISKREEFWDTAPAFDGRQEIWDALKAAVEAVEKNDFELAQAIIDGANIILPSGSLRECYDELGNRYQLPYYVLSFPNNITTNSPKDSPDNLSQKRSKSKTNKKTKPSKTVDPACAVTKTKHQTNIPSRPDELISKVTLNLRLSTGKDFKILVDSNDSIDTIKEQFATICGYPKNRQRWYCYGKLVENDRLLVNCLIPDNCIVQVIVRFPGDSNVDLSLT